jgi:probable HAF family extracellular repeat protein
MNRRSSSNALSVAFAALAALALAAAPQPASAQATYTITDLGTNAYPHGVNDSGSVAGYVTYPATRTSAAYNRAFVRINGTKTEIGTLGGKASEARAINNSGQVVGHSLNAAGAPRAFLYANGSMQDLNTIAGPDGTSAASLGWTLTAAYGINNNGQIVGAGTHPTAPGGIYTDNGTFLWQKDADGNVKVTAVSLPIRQYETRGINDNGLVAGSVEELVSDGSGFDYTIVQASVWNQGVHTNLGFLPGGEHSHAYSINSSSEVVGFSESSAGYRAFLWSNGGGMVSLGTLGDPNKAGLDSCAFNNNDAGQVVGWADRNTSDKDAQYRRAYVWDATNKMRDLNSLSNVGTSWYLQQARDISNNGYIVGYGFVKVKGGSQARGFLLTP